MIASCSYLEETLIDEMQQEGVSGFGIECRHAGGGSENENKAAGREREGGFPAKYMRTGVRKLLRMGLVLASGKGKPLATRTLKRLELRKQMAAAAGKKVSVSLSLFMEIKNLEVEEELSTMPTLSWTEGVWVGKWKKSSRRGWCRILRCRHGSR